MKKLFTSIFTIFLLFINTCLPQNVESLLSAQSQKVVLEYVNFSRIDKAVQKYERLQSQATWIKRLKYLTIGAGCTGLGILIFNNYFAEQDKPKNKSSPVDKLNEKELETAIKKAELKKFDMFVDRFEREEREKKSFSAKMKKGSMKALQFLVYTTIATAVWAFINKSGSILNAQFGGIDLDSDFYKQKGSKINDLIKQMGAILLQHKPLEQEAAVNNFFDLMFADILINHTTLVRWFEDLIGFIKCTVALSIGQDSIEVACLEKDILSLSTVLNQFTDKISDVFNSSSENQEHSKLVEQATTSYFVFCRQFSKFIYDCGLYLYEEDFLQKDSLPENSLQN